MNFSQDFPTIPSLLIEILISDFMIIALDAIKKRTLLILLKTNA